MRVLLDTHAVLWSVLDDPHLSPAARDALTDADNDIVISAVSIFEIALKYRLGKLRQASAFVHGYRQALADRQWTPLPVTLDHAALAGDLDIAHKDPFDRLLIAQALVERVPLISNEAVFDGFGVERLW